jgi:GNAT superfamily N-acetyltransferase
MSGLSEVEPISSGHDCAEFTSGNDEMDRWLKRFALKNAQMGSSRTFVVHSLQAVKGYYALSSAQVLREEAPATLAAGLPRYPIPAVLLARLANDISCRGQGVGKVLLRDAMLRVLRVSEDVGICALIVDAIDQNAISFYEHHGLVRFPENPARLAISIKDIRASAG